MKLSQKFKMASKMAIIFKEYYFYVRTSSGEVKIFRIRPEQSVQQHTKSPGESPGAPQESKMASKMAIN